MTHRVAAGCRGLLDLFVEDVKAVGGAVDLVGRSGQAHDPGLEPRHEIREDRRRVALGIDGDEERLNLRRIHAQPVHDGGDLGQRRRADIGAIGEAEEDQHPAACVILLGANHPGVIRQFEIRTKRRLALRGLVGSIVRPEQQPDERQRRNAHEPPEDLLKKCQSQCAWPACDS